MKVNFALLALSMIGAFALYLLGRLRNSEQFSFLRALNVKITMRSKPGMVLFDAVLTGMLGGLLAYCTTDPVTNAQAISGGLAFIGVLNSTNLGGRV